MFHLGQYNDWRMKSSLKTSLYYLIGAHAALSAFCVGILFARIAVTGKVTFSFLLWNIFLAWIPFALALALTWYLRESKRLNLLSKVTLLGWLFFFPNAPYVVTDFVHLTYVAWYGHAPVWFDIILLIAFAVNGLLLGFSSLYLIQQLLARYYSRTVTAVSVVGFLFLGSLGIYLGRFLRWNSWDIVTQPQGLVFDVFDIFVNPWQHPRSVLFTLLYFLFLLTTYGCLYALTYVSQALASQKKT